ncbi:hypothetical protein GCM10023194_27580 [Planotetraspora phitsanulokensis]|uniref:Uncharacterized protein n=1 Tax=Planotetraspora phitsanulokensis TaxID=575192 RepID=A0A8J3UBQ2_9ACTN|nr:hypothetical protein [Planotetraspora phitsanulokensis]GII36105.1 hypothetical protein Pph01_11080 [Planotetraspora phitsanulokensis]
MEKDTVVESPQITKENAQEHIQKGAFQRLCRNRGSGHCAGSGTAERALSKASI